MRPQDCQQRVMVQGWATRWSTGLFKFTNIPERLECMCIRAVLQIHEANTDKLQDELDKSTDRLRDFNTPLSIVDRTTRQQIKTDIGNVNNTYGHLT